MKKKLPRISSFDLSPGDYLSEKYEVISRLGSGWEGEVYLVRETGTRIDRTVKIFFRQTKWECRYQHSHLISKAKGKAGHKCQISNHIDTCRT